MKPLHIEFARSQRWKTVWIASLAVCLPAIAFFVWRVNVIRTVAAQHAAQVEAQQARLEKLRAPVHTQPDPRRDSIDQIGQLLQLDVNRLFATAENLDIAGVRLRNLSFDTASGSVKLDYELDSLDRASTITEALNSGYQKYPWMFVSVSAANSNPAQGATAGLLAAQQFRGIWSARVNLL